MGCGMYKILGSSQHFLFVLTDIHDAFSVSGHISQNSAASMLLAVVSVVLCIQHFMVDRMWP